MVHLNFAKDFTMLHKNMSTASFKRNNTQIERSSSNDERNDSKYMKITDTNHSNSNHMVLPDAKWIHIFINGDEHFSGCRCVVNSRYYRNLDMFLNYLTERLKPSFGAVRNIYTPINGHPIHNLEDLVSKHRYVAAGNERFKKLEFGYSDIVDKRLKQNMFRNKKKLKVPKAKLPCHTNLTIYFHLNGNFKAKPIKVNLFATDIESWEVFFRKLQDILKCGPIKRICSLSGKPVENFEELRNNQSYVVIGKYEVFKVGHYCLISQHSASFKGKCLAQHSSKKSSSVITEKSSAVYAQSSTRSAVFNLARSTHKNNPEKYQCSAHDHFNIAEPGNGVECFDSCNAHKIIKGIGKNESKIKIDFDDDFSGIFRSKGENHLTDGAVEVEDSSDTVIDLPVDLLDAEEVEEEITPDMERSLQRLSLDVSEEIVAYLPTMQDKQNSSDTQVSKNKYDLNHPQSIDAHNIIV